MNAAARKDIDFLPLRIKLARRKKKQRMIRVFVSACCAAAVFLAVWVPFKLEKDYLARAGELDEKLAALNRAAPVYDQMIAKQKEYEQKKQALEYLEESGFKVIPFLEKISAVTPAGVYISQLSVKADEGAEITFITPDPVKTATLVVGLRRLGIFESVDIETVPFNDNSRPVYLNLRFKWASEKPRDDVEKEEVVNKNPGRGAEIDAAIKEAERKIRPQ